MEDFATLAVKDISNRRERVGTRVSIRDLTR